MYLHFNSKLKKILSMRNKRKEYLNWTTAKSKTFALQCTQVNEKTAYNFAKYW
jgi:hypothetical protein